MCSHCGLCVCKVCSDISFHCWYSPCVSCLSFLLIFLSVLLEIYQLMKELCFLCCLSVLIMLCFALFDFVVLCCVFAVLRVKPNSELHPLFLRQGLSCLGWSQTWDLPSLAFQKAGMTRRMLASPPETSHFLMCALCAINVLLGPPLSVFHRVWYTVVFIPFHSSYLRLSVTHRLFRSTLLHFPVFFCYSFLTWIYYGWKT